MRRRLRSGKMAATLSGRGPDASLFPPGLAHREHGRTVYVTQAVPFVVAVPRSAQCAPRRRASVARFGTRCQPSLAAPRRASRRRCFLFCVACAARGGNATRKTPRYSCVAGGPKELRRFDGLGFRERKCFTPWPNGAGVRARLGGDGGLRTRRVPALTYQEPEILGQLPPMGLVFAPHYSLRSLLAKQLVQGSQLVLFPRRTQHVFARLVPTHPIEANHYSRARAFASLFHSWSAMAYIVGEVREGP